MALVCLLAPFAIGPERINSSKFLVRFYFFFNAFARIYVSTVRQRMAVNAKKISNININSWTPSARRVSFRRRSTRAHNNRFRAFDPVSPPRAALERPRLPRALPVRHSKSCRRVYPPRRPLGRPYHHGPALFRGLSLAPDRRSAERQLPSAAVLPPCPSRRSRNAFAIITTVSITESFMIMYTATARRLPNPRDSASDDILSSSLSLLLLFVCLFSNTPTGPKQKKRFHRAAEPAAFDFALGFRPNSIRICFCNLPCCFEFAACSDYYWLSNHLTPLCPFGYPSQTMYY